MLLVKAVSRLSPILVLRFPVAIDHLMIKGDLFFCVVFVGTP